MGPSTRYTKRRDESLTPPKPGDPWPSYTPVPSPVRPLSSPTAPRPHSRHPFARRDGPHHRRARHPDVRHASVQDGACWLVSARGPAAAPPPRDCDRRRRGEERRRRPQRRYPLHDHDLHLHHLPDHHRRRREVLRRRFCRPSRHRLRPEGLTALAVGPPFIFSFCHF